MPPLMLKMKFEARVDELLLRPDRKAGFVKSPTNSLHLLLSGIDGDCHTGLTRKSDSRTLPVYPRNIDIRNVRQATIVSAEELAEVAAKLGIPALPASWLGANMTLSGIPNLTLLPPSSRLQFPSGATLVVDMENMPCRQVSDVVAETHPDQASGFVKAATNKRGLTAWVEREGIIRLGDTVQVWVPPQRIYAHG